MPGTDPKIERIKDCIERNGLFSTPEVHVLNWSYVHPYMKNNILYTPGGTNGKSFSADLIIELKTSTLAIQWKAVEKPMGIREIADELFKASLGQRAHKGMTFLVVATHLDEEAVSKKSKAIHDPDDKNTIIAYRISAGTKLLFSTDFFNNQRNNFVKYGKLERNQNEVEVPKGMEVIILTRPGLMQFLTPQNLLLLESTQARTIEIMHALDKAMACAPSVNIRKQEVDDMIVDQQ